MEIPSDKQYEFITAQMRYFNEKIIQAFTLFLRLGSGIIAGVFFLHVQLQKGDLTRCNLRVASSGLFVLIGLSTTILILNNLFAWRGYRRLFSEQYPAVPLKKSVRWWFNEATMCVLVVFTCIGFLIFNPI